MVFHGFGWFPWFLKVSRWIFIVINGPRLVKSELSAAGTKWDVKNTKKVLTSSVSWPHEMDDYDDDDDKKDDYDVDEKDDNDDEKRASWRRS